jgi:Fe2+ or Zn2+ uptake regulation protein
MSPKEHIFQELSEAGYRLTQPRQAVIRTLLENEDYASPAQVHARAQGHYPGVSLVTVYRTLDLLAELGFVRRIHTKDGCHGYAIAGNGHRHHLICRHCGAAVEFEGCDLSAFLARVGQETGFIVEDHLLELVGVCSACQ